MHFYSFTVISWPELIFTEKYELHFPGGNNNFFWGNLGYYSRCFVCTFCPWWLCWHLWELVQHSCCMPGTGSKPSSTVGEPRQSGKLGKTHDLLRVTFKCTEAGTEFNFHAAETSQHTPNLVSQQPHIFSVSSCLRRLSKASLLSSGSMKIWEYGSMKSGGRKLSGVEGAFWWMQAKPAQIRGITSCWKLPLPICVFWQCMLGS